MSVVKFIIVDSSYLIRKGLTTIIESIGNTKVVKSVNSINELTNEIGKRQIDIVVINCNFINCYQKHIEQLSNEFPSIDWIILYTDTEQVSIEKSGISLNINDDKSDIVSKLEKIALNKVKSVSKANQDIISAREKNVLKLIASGFTNKQIAEKLFISLNTVITHRKNITNKLGIKSVSGLTVYAILNKIIEFKDIK